MLRPNRKRQPIRGDKNRKLQITRSVRIPNRIWEIGPCCGSQNGAVTQQATTVRCTNQRVYTCRTSVNGTLQIKTSIRNIQSFSVKPQNSVKNSGGKQFSSPVEGVFRSFLHSLIRSLVATRSGLSPTLSGAVRRSNYWIGSGRPPSQHQ